MYKIIPIILISFLIFILLSVPACNCNQEPNPKLSSVLQMLIQAERRGEAEEFARQQSIDLIDGKVRVIVECEYDMIEEATRAARRLGMVELEPIVREDYVYPKMLVVIPITSLNDLAAEKSVKRVEIPHEPIPADG